MSTIKQKHPNLALDALIVAAGVALAILSGHFGAAVGHPLVKGLGAVLGGIYVMYIGCLFLLSFFFPDASYIINFLRYVCEECSRGGKGRHRLASGAILGQHEAERGERRRGQLHCAAPTAQLAHPPSSS